MDPYFVKAGYCTYSLTYGKRKDIPLLGGLAPIESNAQEVGTFADKILAATGASQLDIVGWYTWTLLGHLPCGAGKIGRLIGIAPIHHGTTLDRVLVLAKTVGLLGAMGDVLDPIAPALMQQAAGSEFMKKLNNNTDILPGVYQANITTMLDVIVTPFSRCFQSGAAANDILQELCTLDLHEHMLLPESKVVLRWVLNHLDPSTAKTADCRSLISI
ncbi:hypothetical protein BGZ74_011300 [Mortierella antarctica]|nr:hypothetical protein BGZ74_011300 [Mortierella antarctica]